MHLQPPVVQEHFSLDGFSSTFFSSVVFRSRVCNSGRFWLALFRLCSISFIEFANRD